jgi:hypothetical protein
VVLNLLIAVQEMGPAVWLIVKGFGPKPNTELTADRSAA